ncbi:uncharacterized protein LOC122073656 [Macadamia integrifolia]|uniref:uncharacterized protein LOC122073656 n=1 Tax=Macadamia integrifolia TaxID=60698 RepID=UPI001C4F2988|nr:uncharacterized protein LOC122073656 [Macadamia integrifolia]
MGDPKQAKDEKPATVITLSGENRGAAMHVGSESAKREGRSQWRMEDSKTGEDSSTSAYLNSNLQSVNNSIIFNSSFSERNPGVHLVLSHNPKEPISMKEETERIEASKAEFNITPAQKLTYEPRSLFVESSDTDQNNPEKPSHHSCHYSFEKEKDNDKQTEDSSTK